MELKKVFKKIKAYICGSCDNCINRNFCGEHKLAYDMWQYSSSESVPGIASRTDVNYCYKKF